MPHVANCTQKIMITTLKNGIYIKNNNVDKTDNSMLIQKHAFCKSRDIRGIIKRIEINFIFKLAIK